MVIASVITKVLKTTDSDQPAHLPLVLNAASDSESWLFLIVLVTMAYLTKQSYYDLKTMGYFPWLAKSKSDRSNAHGAG